jgi:hypothetical protein
MHVQFNANSRKRRYFDCIVVEVPWQKQLEDNSEGELDEESDLSDTEFEATNEEAVSEAGTRMDTRDGFMLCDDLQGYDLLPVLRTAEHERPQITNQTTSNPQH